MATHCQICGGPTVRVDHCGQCDEPQTEPEPTRQQLIDALWLIERDSAGLDYTDDGPVVWTNDRGKPLSWPEVSELARREREE